MEYIFVCLKVLFERQIETGCDTVLNVDPIDKNLHFTNYPPLLTSNVDHID